MPHFDEQWMGPEQLGRLAEFAESTNHLAGEVVEIGTWQGLSAIPIANAVAPAILHIVDHWQGDNLCEELVSQGVIGLDCPGIPVGLVERDNYGIFMSNMAEATAGNFEVHKQDWRQWAQGWGAKPIRFLHLDAGHTETEVFDNIEAVMPWMVPGGVLAGDDFDWPGVQSAVYRHFQGPRLNVLFNKLWWITT